MNKERASTSQTNQSVDNEADNQLFGRRSSNGRNRSQGRQPQGQVRYLSKRDFKELFRFEENDRDKRELKKDFKALDKNKDGRDHIQSEQCYIDVDRVNIHLEQQWRSRPQSCSR
mgnify:CR=1 FL=1